MSDKNQAMIDFLMECPTIRDNQSFFNFINAKDNNKQFQTVANDTTLNKPFIDGSVQKRFTFTIVDYRSVTYQPLVTDGVHVNENVEEVLDVQGIMDWIEEQNDLRVYPNFGEHCIIDSMTLTTNVPQLNGVDTKVTPALAKYSFSIQIQYLDKSKMIWS